MTETGKQMKLVECPVCGQEYGFYLHYCPLCGARNETEEYHKYWSERNLANKS